MDVEKIVFAAVFGFAAYIIFDSMLIAFAAGALFAVLTSNWQR